MAGNLFIPSRQYQKKIRIPETDSRHPETEIGSLEIVLRVRMILDTLETGLHKMPRSLVAPHKEAQADFIRILLDST